MDFYQIKEKCVKKGVVEVYPDWKVCRTKDLMVRSKSFYAVWDEEQGMWSTDEYDVQRLVDKDLIEYRSKMSTDDKVILKTLGDFSSKSWVEFKKYMNHISDNAHLLDDKLIFQNSEVKKKDYASKRLSYPLEPGKIDAYEELMSTLYDPEERAKIEWAIGAVISGDAKKIQKFLVLFGEAGTGKSTILNIIQKLFDGYYTAFEAKALTSSSNSFSTEVFRGNPLVAIQHDGDLSRIEDNTKLNSIVSHEEMTINEKFKPSYTARINCFLFMGTNKPVRITDSRSGVIRRLIDVRPSGRKIEPTRYQILYELIDFELGAIADHCLNVYLNMGRNYYNSYRPIDMMMKTDIFYNYVEENYYLFKENDGVTLKQAYEMYKQYCDEALVEHKLPMYKFREELKTYFKSFTDVARLADGKQVRSYYSGFIFSKFKKPDETAPLKAREVKDAVDDAVADILDLTHTESLFDTQCANCPAQLASKKETPSRKWSEVKTKLRDISTTELHYVKPPSNMIVIDFDLKNERGEKDFKLNAVEAAKWPRTYAELSKGGSGIHLHYLYDGNPDELSRLYSEDIEVKVFKGDASLRRRLSKCNATEIATIPKGYLPLRKAGAMINFDCVVNEKALRTIITKSLHKEYAPHATKTSVDFIYKVLQDAYDNGLEFDVRDMRPAIVAFANNSTHNSEYCLKQVSKMIFCSENYTNGPEAFQSGALVFYDVEVFPNLFVIVYKMEGKKAVTLINPTSDDVENLLRYKLVGFNCRRYDNHILYARLLGYNNEDLYRISKRIIDGSKNATFGSAYNLSYADVYDFSAKKQSLKKFEIELGIHHQELGLPWDEPVDESLWEKVADYCINDVVATEAVFNARKQDFIAREILADISGLSVNDTTQKHTAKIIFQGDLHPQDKFVYTDLSEMFPGYVFDNGQSTYRGEVTGEGGYVYSEPGMYENVALLDIASMHPNSLINLNAFGPYTENFKQLLDARLAIKHRDFELAKQMLNGALAPYLESEEQADALAYALKIIINSVYGLTSAKFDCLFKDPRNIDNIVAKRGALFMINLKHEVQARGFTVAHIKTDSIKIPNATQEIIDFVMDYGKQYGYTFEHEDTYSKLCLVNDAVYIAKYSEPHKNKKTGNDIWWTATGTQFQVPYVFKTLFSKEPIEFRDLCETKTVSTALYLDFNEDLPEDEHNYLFVGKAGLFCPILPGCGGGLLLRQTKEGTYASATGAKGFRWKESEIVEQFNLEADIDRSYYQKFVDDAVKDISKYGDFEQFVS